jgi:hypothetical protein
LRVWVKATLASSSWKDVLAATVSVSILFALISFVVLTFHWLGVYGPEVRSLSGYLRPPRQGEPPNGRNRVFPTNE